MTGVVALLFGFTALIFVVVGVASRISQKKTSHTSFVSPGATPGTRSSEDRAMFVAQLRAVAAVLLSVVLFVILLRASMVFTGLAGLGVALIAGLSTSAGLLLFSALPPAKLPSRSTASASLVPRKPWSFGVQRTFMGPIAIMATFFAFLVTTGLTSSPDGQGRYRVLKIENASSTFAASSYPGWFYGIPLILVTLLLALSMFLALHRISSVPSLPDPRMATLDRRWREISTRIVIRLGTGALLGYFGGTAVVAGQALISIASSFVGTIPEEATPGPTQPLFALGVTSAAVGAALAVTGVIMLALAVRDVLTIRASARAANTEPVTAA